MWNMKNKKEDEWSLDDLDSEDDSDEDEKEDEELD